jgi:trimeric autotransporter adhesin
MKGQYLCIGFLAIAISLHAQVPGDEHWDVRFGPSGTENTILTVMRHGTNVYVAGFFSMAGGVNATNVARWDGQDWHAMGPGIGRAEGSLLLSYVYSLATDGTHIYAGGQFTNSGALATTSSVVRWDGTNWRAVGNLRGLPGYLGFTNGFLYAGGTLAVPGDTNAYAVARWDGSSWNTLGSVVRGSLAGAFNFRFEGSEVHAFGTFTNIGGIAANSAAKWAPGLTGSGWEALGGGFTGGNVLVSGVAMHNGQLHVSGNFQNADGVPAQNMAVWTGTGWAPFSGANNEVRRIHSDGTHLYAAGNFTNIGGVNARRAARWNGSQWEPLGEGITPNVFDAVLNGSELLVCGNFINAGSTASVACIARWDGSQWHALNTGRQNGMNLPVGLVVAFDVFNDSLYAGGTFTGAGPLIRNRIARWDGNAWSSLGDGIIGPTAHRVRAITHMGNDLYAGGTFTNAGGIIASNIARWDGSTWHALGSGVNSNVHAMADFAGTLLVGGAFTRAGGVPANRLAQWNGSTWSEATSVNSNVNAIMIRPDGLPVIGGLFTMVQGAPANKVAIFTWGAGWHGLGANVMAPGGSVTALAMMGEDLYIGGSFVVSSINATNIVKVSAAGGWSALGGGVIGRGTTLPINALAVRGHELFAAGTITNAGGVEVRAMARWDGTNWHAMGSGFERDPGDPTLSALAVFQNSIYVGGSFTRAGGRPSVGIAGWMPEIPLRITGGTFGATSVSVNAETMPGLKLRLDGSSDLSSWVPVESVKSYSEVETLTDANPVTGRRFYRVVAEP